MVNQIFKMWYQKKWPLGVILLLPLSLLFKAIICTRTLLYQKKILKTYRPSCPVIIVGNITTGGTGKTPFVIWLARFLKKNGFRPGIVTRGVGGKKHRTPHRITDSDHAAIVGDEALLLYRRAHCPIIIGLNRSAAVKKLLQETKCDIVISDDGLQHYALMRDVEIAMVDDDLLFGNQKLLPAGPLREPISRLNKVDFVVTKRANKGNENSINFSNLKSVMPTLASFEMCLTDEKFINLVNEKISLNPESTVHAVAGIGNPNPFFTLLKQKGFKPIEHVFKDHMPYQMKHFKFNDDLQIVMTEKDAVKCFQFANERFFFLEVTAKMNCQFEKALLEKLQQFKGAQVHAKLASPAFSFPNST